MAESQDDIASLSKADSEIHPKEKQNEATSGVLSDGSQIAPPSDVVELCEKAFVKSAEYFRGELDGTVEDYKLLEKMNQLTTTKYSEMKHIALSISSALKDLNDKYKNLQPYLEQIDQIEKSVTTLEQLAYSLDQYSKSLENKFKALEKK